MERIVKDRARLLTVATALLLSACAKTEFVSVKNNTPTDLVVEAIFMNEHGEHTITLPLKSGENDLWRYESFPWEASTVDNDLIKIRATNDKGCSIVYDRDTIEMKTKDNHGEIAIDQKEFIDRCVP
jgi:hypothetical protein